MQTSNTARLELERLEEFYQQVQNLYAKLTVTHYTLKGPAGDSSMDDSGADGIEAEHDSRLEEKEVDDIHTSKMIELGAKYERDADAEEARLATAREAVLNLAPELVALIGQDERVGRMREELAHVRSRAESFDHAKARRAELERRLKRVSDRKNALAQQQEHHASSWTRQNKLKADLESAQLDLAKLKAAQEKQAGKVDIIVQMLS